MKKILVLSDSHGNIENMKTAVKNTQPDLVIHLGDCRRDAEKLAEHFPDLPMVMVNGNCDYSLGDTEKLVTVEGHKLLACHGHTYGVKSGYLRLSLAAKEKGADIALFGHTHQLFYDYGADLFLFNPGSIGSPPYGQKPSYGLLTIEAGKYPGLKTFYMEG